MRKMKQVFTLLMVLLLALSPTNVFADGGREYGNGNFKDVEEGHWAHDYIQLMVENGIINGYDDGTFRPSETVSRAEFAKMLVLTLGLDLVDPSTQSFLDVDDGDWAFPYVETAKYYLTGYKVSEGYDFRPNQVAVREDMAVAVVKGLGINVDDTDEAILEQYSDSNGISTNLRKYVAAAINEGIMIGSNNKFSAQSSLSRAEAATLLARLIVDEKVVFEDGDKIVMDGETTTEQTPVLSTKVVDDQVVLEWTKVSADNFAYYKVAISKDNDSPKYPDVGYFKPLSGVDNNRYVLESGMSHGGLVLKGGEDYYVAITAVYDDGKYTSNVQEVEIPGEYTEPSSGSRTPVLKASVEDKGVELEWTQTESSGFKYYKVVLSKNNTTPSYPGDGYLTYITDVTKTSYYVQEEQKYNGGDLGGEVDDETYYMTITAVYNDGKYTSNTLKVTVPDL